MRRWEDRCIKMKNVKWKKWLVMLTVGVCGLVMAGCGMSGAVSPSDTSRPPVSSEAPVVVNALEAAEILVDGEKNPDVFLLGSDWYGVSYQNKDSLNKIMMMKYSGDDSVIPQARDGAKVSLLFASPEGMPEEVTVTRQGNTVKANTGIPYDINETELSRDGQSGYCFAMDFGEFSMYYFVVDCRWSNGNTAEYAFALERSAE